MNFQPDEAMAKLREMARDLAHMGEAELEKKWGLARADIKALTYPLRYGMIPEHPRE